MTKTTTRIAGGALALGGALSLVFAGTAAAAPVNPENVSLTVTADRSPAAHQNDRLVSTLVIETDYTSPNYCRWVVVPEDANPDLVDIAWNNVDESMRQLWVGSYGDVWGFESDVWDVSGVAAGDYKYVTSCYTNGAQEEAVAGPVVHFSIAESDGDGDNAREVTVVGSDAPGGGDDNDDDNGNGGDEGTGSLDGGSLGSGSGSGSLSSLGS